MESDRELVQAWSAEFHVLIALAQSVPASMWRAPTRLAGWTIADVFAHICDIEAILVGDPRADREPDWTTLTHATSEISRFTEVGVDARRGLEQDDVISELASLSERRTHQIDQTPTGSDVMGPTGKLRPLGQVLRMRCLDMWVHEQDVLDALGRPGTFESPAATITLTSGLALAGRAWQAQDPSPGHLHITVDDWDGSPIDLGGEGDELHLACSRSELLELLSGRTMDVDPRWRALNIAP